MKIHRWQLSEAAKLSEVYNQQTVGIPCCFPLSAQEFEQGVCSQPEPIYPYKKLQLHAAKLIVGEEGGEIIGFAHVAKLKKETIHHKIRYVGLIRFLTYRPTHRLVGQAILTEAEKYCSELELDEIQAFDPVSYHFYCLNARSLSSKMTHILALFGINNYQIKPKYFSMRRQLAEEDMTDPILPNSELKIVVIQKEGQGILPNLRLELWRGTNRIGICNTSSGGMFCRAKPAPKYAYTTWIKVETEARRQGMARYLMQKTFFELQKIGYQHVCADVRTTNYKAQMLHTQAGYQVTDTKYYALKSLNR
jgi:hypothetical protein